MTRPNRSLVIALLTVVFASARSDSGAASLGPAEHPRIVNGLPTQDRPTTGALLTATAVGGGDFLSPGCSVTLVGCQHAVTAAHCVCFGNTYATCGTLNPARYRVFLQHAGILGVSAITVNPAFHRNVASDIAILTLSTPVVGIRPMPIDSTGSPPAGTTGTIVGFGDDGYGAFPQTLGILQYGLVTLTSCAAAGVPDPAYVCWLFDTPLGSPGTNSNTCGGDSGGALVVDLGSGDVLAGVTAGRVVNPSAPCRAPETAYDTNVYENLSFIQGVAGSDLANTSCGSGPQVGDAGTTVTTLRFDALAPGAGDCRTAVRKFSTRYATARLKLLQKCIDGVAKGSIVGPCPDGTTSEKIAKAIAKVDAAKLAAACPPDVIPLIAKRNACVSATDANGLASCIIAAGNAAAADLLDAEYADATPSAAIPDPDLRTCQKTITKVMGAYGLGRLKISSGCQQSVDKGSVEVCLDAKASGKIAKLIAKVQPGIAAKCQDADVVALNASSPFGGGCDTVSSVAALASCEITAHDVDVDALVALLGPVGGSHRATFEVAAGTARLEVALNGHALNELDLFVQHGAPPTTSTFTASSTNFGAWESIALTTPASGTWHAYVHQPKGDDSSFQLTMTTFGP